MTIDFRSLTKDICGPVVPLNIPFKENEEVDYAALEKYVDWLAGEGVPIIILTFASSECGSLTDHEIYEITRVAANANNGRAHFVGATRCWPIEETVKYIDFARKHGASAVKIQPNFFSGLSFTSDSVIEYFKKIEDRTQFPLWAYTLLQNGRNSLTAGDVKRLAEEVPSVIAMKNDGEAMYLYYNYIRSAQDNIQIVSGGHMKTMLYGWQLGARAYLCPIAPFNPKVSLQFIECLKRNDYEGAQVIVKRWEDPILALAGKYDWFSLIKSLLQISGHFPTRRVRLPGLSADDVQYKEIEKAFESIMNLK